jgi:hypothetical protein
MQPESVDVLLSCASHRPTHPPILCLTPRPFPAPAATGPPPAQLLKGLHTSATGKIDDRWRRFMVFQIERARQYFADAEAGVDLLDPKARWPVW